MINVAELLCSQIKNFQEKMMLSGENQTNLNSLLKKDDAFHPKHHTD